MALHQGPQCLHQCGITHTVPLPDRAMFLVHLRSVGATLTQVMVHPLCKLRRWHLDLWRPLTSHLVTPKVRNFVCCFIVIFDVYLTIWLGSDTTLNDELIRSIPEIPEEEWALYAAHRQPQATLSQGKKVLMCVNDCLF